MQIDWFNVVAVVAIVVLSFLLFLALFEPGLDYKISSPYSAPLDSPDFLRMLESITDSRVNDCSHVEVLTNGEVYYEAELQALRGAASSINLEAYIFQKGEVTRRFLEVLTERARAGVEVRLVLDWLGSFASWTPPHDAPPAPMPPGGPRAPRSPRPRPGRRSGPVPWPSLPHSLARRTPPCAPDPRVRVVYSGHLLRGTLAF